MKTIPLLVTSLIVAIWAIAIAIISVQNAEPVSLRFLNFQSIQIPVGLILAFCGAGAIVGTALIQPLWSLAGRVGKNSSYQDDVEFFVDDEDL
jgi:uncharacterized integral membrane protein